MSNKVLFYSIYIADTLGLDYYSMLYYSLETLMQHKKSDFDVVVFYQITLFDIHEYKFLDQYNLINDFPTVKFIELPKVECPVPFLSKWAAIENSLKLDYTQFYYVDCDVMFITDPGYQFDKYGGDKVWAIFEGTTNHVIMLLGVENGQSSGQFIYSKTAMSRIPEIYKKVDIAYKQLWKDWDRFIEIHPMDHHVWVRSLLEQYAAQRVFIEAFLDVDRMSIIDIRYGIYTCDATFKDGEITISNIITSIIHYTRNNAPLFIPNRLRTPLLQRKFNILVKNDILTRDLW